MAFSAEDIVPDSPTNNFCTLNPLDDDFDSSVKFTYQEGNLKTSYSFSNAAFQYVFGSLAIPSNSTKKYYWEWTYNDINNNAQHQVGICAIDSNQYTPSARTTGTVKEANVGTLRYHSTSQAPYLRYITSSSATSEGTQIGTMSTSATYNNLSVLSLMYDAGAGKLYGWLNGEELAGQSLSSNTSLWDTFNTSKTYMIMLFEGDGGTSTKNGWIYLNFGQDPTFGGTKTSGSADAPDANGIGSFYYQPPTGALALCTVNLSDFTPDVIGDTPQDYFKAVTYTGNGGTQSITGVGFQPDLVWVKNRTDATSHILSDVIRTAGKAISSESTAAEYNIPTDFQSFDADGFTVGYGGSNITNGSGKNYVAWCWKAGGAPTADNTATSGAMTANSVSLNGTLQSNYTPAGSPTIYPKRMSINTDAGFSIVKYNGNSGGGDVPHGLSQKPDMLIVRPLTTTSDWIVWHKDIEQLSFNYLYLSQTIGGGFVSNYWGSTGVTNTKFGLYAGHTSAGNNNTNAGTSPYPHIAYCWHSVAGYSKCSSYTGNGSTDGPFVYCGFRPAFVICKCSSDTTTTHTSWAMYDNARDSINVMNKVLYANKSINEGYRGDASTAATDIYIDFLSNGFKVRSTKEEVNDSGETYIFMAFAEQPFKFSNAR